TTTVARLSAAQLARPGVVFRHDRWRYRTTGRHVAQGGMGTVHALERRAVAGGPVEPVVAKTFHAHYFYQLRTDEVTLRDHEANAAAVARLGGLAHDTLLPLYVAAPIADNVLMVTPRMTATLLEAISQRLLTSRARAQLLMQAVEGLGCMHQARVLHRD